MNGPPDPSAGDEAQPARRRNRSLVVLPAIWLVLGVAGGVGIVKVVRDDGDPTSTAAITTESPSAEEADRAAAEQKKKARQKAEKRAQKRAEEKARKKREAAESAEPTTQPTTEPTIAATRSIGVLVFNQSGIGGLAARTAGEAQAAGWTVAGTGNWRGGVPQNTIYFPPGQQAEAVLLGQDLAIGRILPAIANMSGSHLTVVLATGR